MRPSLQRPIDLIPRLKQAAPVEMYQEILSGFVNAPEKTIERYLKNLSEKRPDDLLLLNLVCVCAEYELSMLEYREQWDSYWHARL